jgi:hypothetical protein
MTLQDKIHHANEMANAIQRREDFYTLKTDSVPTRIELPTPQVAGTMTQQRTYAMGKAMDIIEQINRTNGL